MDAGLVVQKLPRQPLAHRAPVQPQRVRRHRHQHGPHAKVDPARLAQHGHAGIHHGPAGAPGHQGGKVGLVPVALAQAVVAAVQVVKLQRGFGFEFLDEVAVPVHAAHEGRETLALPARTGLGAALQLLLAPLGGLHHFAHAKATQGKVGRKARAGRGRREGR